MVSTGTRKLMEMRINRLKLNQNYGDKKTAKSLNFEETYGSLTFKETFAFGFDFSHVTMLLCDLHI